MKILGRILYALLVAILLFFFHNFGTRLTADKYFATEGKEIFESNSKDKYRFFYGSTGYHLDEPTYSITANDYHIQFFEINKVYKNKANDVYVDEFYYIMIDHPTEILTIDNPQRFYLKFITNDEPITLRIHQFRDLPFSLVINDENKGLIDVNDLLDKNIVSLEIIDYESLEFNEGIETSLAIHPIELKESDLVIKDIVINNYDNLDVLESNNINTKYVNDTSSYNYLYYLTMLVYLVLAAFTTYFLYFHKSKGKVKPSPHFIKEEKNYK